MTTNKSTIWPPPRTVEDAVITMGREYSLTIFQKCELETIIINY